MRREDVKMVTKEQIGAIWALAHKLGMDRDDVYSMAKVEHLHDLTLSGAVQMIDILKTMTGQTPNTAPRGKPTPKELGMIDGLKRDLGWTDERLRAFLEKRFHCSHVRFMSDKTARKVIEALKAMLAGGRGERRAGND